MNNLLETLVTISRLEALEALSKEQTDISELTEMVIHDVQKIHYEKQITLTTHIQKNVSQKVHKNSWNIIIKNILENAYKFTPERGNIEVTLNKKALTIKDTGKGIAAKDFEHIRERFRQADSSKTDTKSFGL